MPPLVMPIFSREHNGTLPLKQPPLCCSVQCGRRRGVWVRALGPPHSRGGEGKGGQSEGLLCRGRSAGSLGTRSTIAPATPGSLALTGDLHGEEGKGKKMTHLQTRGAERGTVKLALTLSGVAAVRPRITWSRGFLLGEADDTCDLTACR